MAGPTALNLGFLTILQEGSGYLGGFLVTNQWGRPLEFRLTSAVQPNKVQQILYGGSLESYLCADLIGKTLVDKVAVPVHLVLTDRDHVLDLRLKLEVPVVQLAGKGEAAKGLEGEVALPADRGLVRRHPRYPGDVAAVREIVEVLDRGIDLAEPFIRIREAVGEARKMGVTGRNAAA